LLSVPDNIDNMSVERDEGLDALLGLDGETFFVDANGHYRVKFVVKRVKADERKPHGLNYSLTLHDKSGERIVGFDNAHPVPTQGDRLVRNASSTTTGTGSRRSAHMITRTQPPCLKIFGRRRIPS